MADIFFSYSAKDRERVRPICEALTALGFEVFWDQQVPAGTDWDTWIKDQLAAARCAVVFWSLTSIISDNVRHEATVAKQQGRLVPVMLDPLRVDQFPMGLFNTQAARLIEWSGSDDDPEWQKLLVEIENKSMPGWVNRRLSRADAALKAATKQREMAQAREDAAEEQLGAEISKQGQIRRDRDRAQSEAETARAETAGLKEALSAAKAQNDEMAARLTTLEQARPSARKGLPLWTLLIGLLLAGGAAAGVTHYLQADGPGRTHEARADIETREKAIRERSAELETREKTTQERTADLDARAKAMREHGAEVDRRGAELDKRENTLRERGESLDRRESTLRELKEALDRREQALRAVEAQERARREQAEAQERAQRDRAQAEAQQKAQRERTEAEARERARREQAEARQRAEVEARERERRDLEQKFSNSQRKATVLLDATFYGKVLEERDVRTIEECSGVCFRNNRCKGFEFKQHQRTCFTYENVTGGAFTSFGSISVRWDCLGSACGR